MSVDVVVVGGGYSGLWTAYHLLERDPALGIAIIERDICGGGASGRNGGFATGWWDELSRIVELFGPDEGVRLCRALGESIRAIGAFCGRHGVDARYTPGGCMATAAAQAQSGALDGELLLAKQLGVEEELRYLSVEDVRKRCGSPVFGEGAFMRDGATVQPALLARGLRRVLLGKGVRIFEHTEVRGLRSGDPCMVVTETGRVRGRALVLCVNAWGAGWPQLRRLVVPRGSYIALTEPIPELIAELGWTGGECITDLRTAVHYFRTTADGRIAFGGGGASTGIGPSIGRTFTHDDGAIRRTVEGFDRLFPMLRDVEIVDTWGGPIDVGPFHLPAFGRIGEGRAFYVVGYTGNGVGPSELAGRILSGWCLRQDDEWTSLPIAHYRPRRFPPEPFRSVGARLVNAAVVRRDRQMECSDTAGRVTDFLARLPSKLCYRLPPE